jgi:uncharacterized membrane protein
MEEQKQEVVQADPADAEKNKVIAILAYFIFFIPLLAAKDSKFAMYHGNQGLVLFLTTLVVYIVGIVVPFIGWFIILPLGMVVVLIFAILGIINAAGGQMKPLPLIGKFQIIK